jgi:hypothetical protein
VMIAPPPAFAQLPTAQAAGPGEVRPAAAGRAASGSGQGPSPRDAVDLSATARDAMGEPLSKDEQKQVDELRKRDQEVRNHEEAHQRVGGQYASAPSYEFSRARTGRITRSAARFRLIPPP